MSLQSSSTNVNTDTASSTAEPANINGSEAALNFDELEGALNSGNGTKIDRELGVAKAKPKAKKEDDDDETEQNDDDDAAEKPKDVKKLDAGKAKSDADKKKDDGKTQSKVIKIKSGDKEFDLPSDAPIEVTVNGVKEQVPVQELINNYSGKVAWDKKFTEFDKEKKAFHHEKQELGSNIDKMYDLAVNEGDVRGMIEYVSSVMKADPDQVWGNLQKQLEEKVAPLLKMTPEEREAFALKEDNERFRNREAKRVAEQKRQANMDALNKRVTTTIEKHGIDRKRFVELYDDLKTSGMVKVDDITPELIGEYHERLNEHSLINTVAASLEIDPSLVPSVQKELLELKRVNPELTQADLEEIAKEVWGKGKIKGLNQKMKRGPAGAAPKAPTKSTREPFNFDDIE
jgi:hypothetical protein